MKKKEKAVFVKNGDCTELNKYLDEGYNIDGYRQLVKDEDVWLYTLVYQKEY